MTALGLLILQLLAEAPAFVAQIGSLYNAVKSALSATDVTTLDAVFVVLDPKVNADVAKLVSDALARATAA